MTPPPQPEYIITNEGLAELDKYFIEHKDDLIRIAWKNLRDAHIRPYQSERDTVLKELKKDLQSRFVSSYNQWSKGRNSGLLECCNLIDEYLTTFRHEVKENSSEKYVMKNCTEEEAKNYDP